MSELGLVDKILGLHRALVEQRIPHAFGGALALAWCVGEVRATVDIDCNIFVGRDGIGAALEAMPDGVTWSQQDRDTLDRDLQVRLRWGRHPVDVFFNATAFHEEAADRVRHERLADTELPFLACGDLAVFKVFFDRGKDWVDLEAMATAGTTDWTRTFGVLASHLGAEDPRIRRLEDLLAAT